MGDSSAPKDSNVSIQQGGALATALSGVRLLFWEANTVVVGGVAKLLISGSVGAFFIGITRFTFHREALDAASGAVLFGFLLSILSYLAAYVAMLSKQSEPASVLHGKLLQTILVTVITALIIFAISYLIGGGLVLGKIYEWIEPLNLAGGMSVWLAMIPFGLSAVILIALITEPRHSMTAPRLLQICIWSLFYTFVSASVLKFAVIDQPLEFLG